MTGGGVFGWASGEWTDDTQTALAVLVPLSRGSVGPPLVEQIEEGSSSPGTTAVPPTSAIRPVLS